MAVKKKSLKDSLKAKDLSYSNDFFNYKHNTIVTADSFTYNAYNALNDVMDAKTNNYSNIFLTKTQENADWLEVNEKETPDLNIVTTISFYSNDIEDLYNPGVWLYFDKTYEFWDAYLKDSPYAMTWGRPSENLHNYFFYIEYIDDTRCRISHNFGDLKFYLGCESDLNIKFMVDDNPELVEWFYSYEDVKVRHYTILKENKLRLYKKVTDKDGKVTVYSLTCKETDSEDDEEGWKLSLSDNVENVDEAVIYINDAALQMDVYVDNSFVSYDQSKYITAIDRDRSAFHLQAQAMLHHQYNKEEGMNFVPLKVNTQYQGGHARGSNLTLSSTAYPDVTYRQYNAIHSGENEEYGNSDITLNYYFTDQTYRIKDGEIYEFYIPSVEENGGIEPLWPYKKMNIVDTKFIKNGAFASNVPYFSDRFSKLQGPYSICLDENGNNMSANNGTYLCTWLYAYNEKNAPIWVDRYYYPDKMQRLEALEGIAKFDESFENIIDKNYDRGGADLEDLNPREVIRENTYFDKVSDLTIEPQNHYRYDRISSKQVAEVNENIKKWRIEEVEDQAGAFTYLADRFVPENKKWLRIYHSLFNKTNKINLNTDIFIDPIKRIGIQLFGSDYKHGFNIQNRKDLSPFHYYCTNKTVYMLNNNFEIRHSFELFDKYNDNIIKLIIGDVFDDVVIITNLYIYLFAWDLKLKTRVHYQDILDLDKIDISGGVQTKLLDYPYAGSYVELEDVWEHPASIDTEEEVPRKGVVETDIERFDNSIIVDFNMPKLEMFLNSNIADIFAAQNAISYNNNLYIPYEQDIIKIIFMPDSENDSFLFEEMKDYPCKARKLGQDEFFVNYIRTGQAVEEEAALENGFIEVENKIKHLYINGDGKIYGFNFDKIAMSHDGNTIYGLYAWDKYIDADGWNWLYNQQLSKIEAMVGSSKFAEFGSDESIDFIRMNEHGDMLLVRGLNKPSEDEKLVKRIELYDITKKRWFQYFLEDFDDVICVDAYNYITENDVEKSVFMVLATRYNAVYKLEVDALKGGVTVTRTELPVEFNDKFVETTNSNSLVRYANENKLYFNLYLPTSSLYDYKETMVWDISESQRGWYNVNVSIDLDKAEFAIKINDIELENKNQTEMFEPYVYSDGNIFDSTYYVANIGKQYGTTMDKILSDSTHDPYVCKNVKFENMKLFNKALEYYEYQAMRLEDKPINEINLTLPCGQRTNIEEIIRYFKYNPPSAVSNKVKINISGTGLATKGELQLLEREIREVLENESDCLVDVKTIDFI